MPSLIPGSPLSTNCVACCRWLTPTAATSSPLSFLPHTQVRGKKKNAKARTHLNIRLVKDLAGHGRKGSIIPVPIGLMRNHYFPRHLAEYIPASEVREHKRHNTVFQRDFEFTTSKQTEVKSAGAEIKTVETRQVQQPARETQLPDHVRVELDLLQPKEAFEALSQAIPPFVNFYRTPISPSDIASVASDAGRTKVMQSAPASESANIYGSVSTADIATNLKALLASSDLAGKIVLADSDIHFVRTTPQDETDEQHDEASRVKQLGDYEITIKVKGHTELIRRLVRVLPENATTGAAELKAQEEMIAELAAENPIAGAEPNPEIEALETQVQELEISIKEAKRSVGAPGEMPTIGGAGTFGKQKGGESGPGSINEGTGRSRDAQQRL